MEKINRSPTQLSFPPSDSTLDMLGVILQGLVNKENGKICFSLTSSLPCCVSPKGEAWFCMCACVFLRVFAV